MRHVDAESLRMTPFIVHSGSAVLVGCLQEAALPIIAGSPGSPGQSLMAQVRLFRFTMGWVESCRVLGQAAKQFEDSVDLWISGPHLDGYQ